MALVSDIAREAVAQLGLDSGFELAGQFVSQAYVELCGKASFRHLRKLGQLYLPAPLGFLGASPFGQFTVTIASPIILADANASAALAAAGSPASYQGQWWRLQQGSVWYRILRVDPTNSVAWTVTLETPYAADNNATGIFPMVIPGATALANYYIIPRFINLPPAVRTVGTMVCDAVYRPLENVSEDELNLMYSSRQLVAFPPRYWAMLGNDQGATGMPCQIEIFPWPVNSTTLHFTYWMTPPDLTLDDSIPPGLDADILREGAKKHLMSNQAGKAIRSGNLEAAAYWRNEYRMQTGLLERLTSRAVKNDRGVDSDIKFILRRSAWCRPGAPLDWDPVNDAWTNFLSRGI